MLCPVAIPTSYLDIGERQLEGHVLDPEQGVVRFGDHEPLEVSSRLGGTILHKNSRQSIKRKI